MSVAEPLVDVYGNNGSNIRTDTSLHAQHISGLQFSFPFLYNPLTWLCQETTTSAKKTREETLHQGLECRKLRHL